MSASWIGFLGTFIVIVAYVPQIAHLIKAQCSAGISLKAYGLWLGSSLLCWGTLSISVTAFSSRCKVISLARRRRSFYSPGSIKR